MKVKTVRQQLYSILKQRIMDGEYEPGEHLNIDAIGRELGVSNSPLREALTLLVKDGLVEIRPNVGMNVMSFSPQKYLELVDMVNTWIIGAYNLCVRDQKTDLLIQILEEQYRVMEDAGKASKNKEFIYAILDFERSFVRATGNQLFISTFDSSFDAFRLAYYYNHIGLALSYEKNLQRAHAVIEAVRIGAVEDVQDAIWGWSVIHFKEGQMAV
ncbi:MAG: GntR family transcriptional regulator [Lachnospiraceae bacterium]